MNKTNQPDVLRELPVDDNSDGTGESETRDRARDNMPWNRRGSREAV